MHNGGFEPQIKQMDTDSFGAMAVNTVAVNP
jgi:hypothetical protein